MAQQNQSPIRRQAFRTFKGLTKYTGYAKVVNVNGSPYTAGGNGDVNVRLLGGVSGDETIEGNVYSVPIEPGKNLLIEHGRLVYIGIGIDGRPEITRNDRLDLKAASIPVRQLNRADKALAFWNIENLTNLNSFPEGGTGNIEIIPSIYRKASGEYGLAPTASQADVINLLSSYTPATASNQLVASIWLDTDTNTYSVTASSEVSSDVDLKLASGLSTGFSLINECVASAPTNNIGVWSYIIKGSDTEVGLINKFQDLRGIIGTGGGNKAGFPNPVTGTKIVAAGYQEYTYGNITTTGTLTINGRLRIVA